MKKNIGATDKLIRVVIAFMIGVFNYLAFMKGLVATFLLAFAIYLAITALLNYSPFYRISGINTTKK